MSQLRIFAETDGSVPTKVVTRHADIARELRSVGVRFIHEEHFAARVADLGDFL